jgi:hypothetical protein
VQIVFTFPLKRSRPWLQRHLVGPEILRKIEKVPVVTSSQVIDLPES